MPVLGQTPVEEHGEAQVELSDLQVSEDDYTEYLQQLEYFLKHPLDINTADAAAFANLHLLNPLQIAALLQHRSEHGPFQNIAELQTVDGFDAETIRRLSSYVKVVPRLWNRTKGAEFNPSYRLNFTIGSVVQQRKGFKVREEQVSPAYAGDAMQAALRFRAECSESISLSLVAAKDAGERWWTRHLKSKVDFFSAGLMIKGKGMIRKLIVGDYTMQGGQGLVIAPGFSFGKGASVTTLARQQYGLRHYSSTNEDRFMRGAAISVKIADFNLAIFQSNKALDASVYHNDGQQSIKTFVRTGLHRTGSELANRGRFREALTGAAIRYEGESFNLGTLFCRTRFSLPFAAGLREYQKYHYQDQDLSNLSVYYSFNWGRKFLFGETAKTIVGGWANIHGIIVPVNEWLSWVCLFRDYQKRFHSFYFQAISEGSAGTAERGFLNGVSLKLSRKSELFLYADFYKFPWLRYGVDEPSTGYELFSQYSKVFSKHTKLIVRGRYKLRQENTDKEDVPYVLDNVERSNLRAELQYRWHSCVMKSRIESCMYSKAAEREYGILAFHDITFKKFLKVLDARLRAAYFDTDSYNSAIWAMENNLLYAYSIPVFHYRGMRFVSNLRMRINAGTQLALRYAMTRYLNREVIGSGNDEILGSMRSDFFAQLILNL